MPRLIVLLCFGLAACDVINGFGQDMQITGSAISARATQNKYGYRPAEYPPPPQQPLDDERLP